MNTITVTMPRILAQATMPFFADSVEQFTPDPELDAFLHEVYKETTFRESVTWAHYTVLTLTLPRASSLYFVGFLSDPEVFAEFQMDLLEQNNIVGLQFLAVLFNHLSVALEQPNRFLLSEDAYIPMHIETIVGRLHPLKI